MDFSYLLAGSCRDLGAFSRLYGILSGSRVLDSAALLSSPPPNGIVKRHRESLSLCLQVLQSELHAASKSGIVAVISAVGTQ